jgi:hypothetical protein
MGRKRLSPASRVPSARPRRTILRGRHGRLVPLDPKTHAAALFEAFAADRDGRIWTYMGYGPFADHDAHAAHARAQAVSDDPLFFVVENATREPLGVASYLRMQPEVDHGLGV